MGQPLRTLERGLSLEGDVLAYFCPGCMNALGENTDICPSCEKAAPGGGWPKDPYLGRTIGGKYRLESKLGAGGFALVFLARQVEGGIDLGDVVLKFLHRNLAQNESIRKRFINEARAARQVRSPHAVKMFDLGFDEDGTPYLVMEFLEGESLQDVLDRRGQLSPAQTFRIGLQVAGALDECHGKGIIHRDLKPDNLLLLPGRGEDFTKVLDFGIARVPDKDGSVTHTVMGTPRYMPPEQIMMEEMDGGVDIFALGVILYECLAGRAPIQAATPMAYMQLNLSMEPTPLRELRPDLPADLETLLNMMMSKDRGARPQSMADVERRLLSLGKAHGWVARTTGELAADQLPAEEPQGTSRLDDAGVVFDMTLPSTDQPGESMAQGETLPPGESKKVTPPEEKPPEEDTSYSVVMPRRRPWLILVTLALLLVVGGAFMATRGGDNPEPPATVEKPAAVAAPEPAAAPDMSIAPDLEQVGLKPDLAPDQKPTPVKRVDRPRKTKKTKQPPPKAPAPVKPALTDVDDEYGDRSGGL